ncbi:MAG: hypothetical protein HZC25_06480 [Rhodospirillales bacterium]|nr:hypothetical protein [Rhodospirillales bacterium]
MKTKLLMTEQRGTPRELAERLAGLPEGQYRVVVQPLRSREDVLAGFDDATETLRRNPPPEAVGRTDDAIADFADTVVQDIRRTAKPN